MIATSMGGQKQRLYGLSASDVLAKVPRFTTEGCPTDLSYPEGMRALLSEQQLKQVD
jgi:hypothetical protein